MIMNLNNENKKLKPVTFIQGEYPFHRQNKFQQNLLLKALQVTTDPKKLKEMIGVKSVAEVYRTLDKLAIRKEYHEALAKNGIDFDFLTNGIKSVCDSPKSTQGERLKGFQILLKSLGLDEYKEVEGAQVGWEDALIKMLEDESQKTKERVVYDVVVPEIPDEEKRLIEQESRVGKSIYE